MSYLSRRFDLMKRIAAAEQKDRLDEAWPCVQAKEKVNRVMEGI